MSSKRLLGLLAAVGLLAAPALASPVRFDNPAGAGHFDWSEPGVSVFLDLTLPPDDPGQPPAPDSASGVSQAVYPPEACVLGGNVWGQVTGDLGWAVAVNEGDMITGAGEWAGSPLVYVAQMGGSPLPEGVELYLPVAFDPWGEPGSPCTIGGPDCHYGWIGVVRTGLELDVFAYGYETEALVPIAAGAPEPATLAPLAVGAVTLIRRRR